MQKRDLCFEVSPREFAYAEIIEYSTQLFTEDKVCYSVTRGNGRILNIFLAPVWLIIVYIFFYQIRSDMIIAVYITCLIGKFRGHLCSEPFVANSSIDFFFEKYLVPDLVYKIVKFLLQLRSKAEQTKKSSKAVSMANVFRSRRTDRTVVCYCLLQRPKKAVFDRLRQSKKRGDRVGRLTP